MKVYGVAHGPEAGKELELINIQYDFRNKPNAFVLDLSTGIFRVVPLHMINALNPKELEKRREKEEKKRQEEEAKLLAEQAKQVPGPEMSPPAGSDPSL
jgi:hypothetical protein